MISFSKINKQYGKQVLWPDHCVQGTEGAALSKELAAVIYVVAPFRQPLGVLDFLR